MVKSRSHSALGSTYEVVDVTEVVANTDNNDVNISFQ